MWQELEDEAKAYERVEGAIYKQVRADILAKLMDKHRIRQGMWIELAGKYYSWYRDFGKDDYVIRSKDVE